MFKMCKLLFTIVYRNIGWMIGAKLSREGRMRNDDTTRNGSTNDANEPSFKERTRRESTFNAVSKHYQVINEIGRGKRSKVYQATNLKHGELCAVKVYRKEDLTTETIRLTIFQEVYILKRLNHTNILNLHLVHDNDQFVFVQSQYCFQGNLNDRLKVTTFMNEIRILEIMKQLFQALQYLHDHGIAHCDIRPESLLFSARGTLKVANFGCAYIRSDGDDGECFVHCGEKPFRAPETLTEQSYNPTLADLWSAGAILYLMMTKKKLFHEIPNSNSDNDNGKRIVRARKEIENYSQVSQEDIGINMLDINVTKRSKMTQKLLWRLLQMKPYERIGTKEGHRECVKGLEMLNEALNNRRKAERDAMRD